MATERLDKIIASRCDLSRKEARGAIRRGEALAGGQPVTDPGMTVDLESVRIIFRGQAIDTEKHIYIMMNKPKGVVCAREDRRDKTVVELLPDLWRRKDVFPVGRLDKDTTGLLILTNDGDFAHRLISPKYEIYKTYIATLDGEITDETVRRFREGVVLHDGTVCREAFLRRIDSCLAQVKICEGKYHQVKRMFGTEGLGVNELKRIAIGDLHLPDDLEEGTCRELDKTILESLFFVKKELSVHFD